MKNLFRHLTSFIAPVVMAVVIPYLIVSYEHQTTARPWITPSPILQAAGLLGLAGGLSLFILTVRTFLQNGKGTIMPWDPTRRLVLAGPYRHVRNPMILSLLVTQVGEAVLFSSWGIALLAALFFVINTVYFIRSEEPGLVKRFGAEYLEYRRNVSRWVPRLKPWEPDENDATIHVQNA